MKGRVLSVILLLTACSSSQGDVGSQTFVLATTTSTQDSGLLDLLTAEFEGDNPGLWVKVIALGSGEAIELARRGDADVLLAHSPKQELEFMAGGRGIFRRSVMSNNFTVAGPASDPGEITSAPSVSEAFRFIGSRSLEFVSRGDLSGTHTKELSIWDSADIDPKSHAWYFETGQGMGETLIVAGERGSYVLADTATLLVYESRVVLESLFSGDSRLDNPYHVIPVKKSRHERAGIMFAEWITSVRGQSLIGSFGTQTYGDPLFDPEKGAP